MRTAVRRASLGACIAVGGAYAATLFVPARGAAVAWAHDVVPILVPVVAGAACIGAATRASPRAKASWALLAAGALAWAAGDTAYTVLDKLGQAPDGSFSVADAGYLLLIPAWCAALILHPARPRRGLDLLGAVVEAVTVLVAAATLTATYVFLPTLRSVEDFAGAAVLLAYPVGDLALLAAFGSLMARSNITLRSAESLVAAAVFTFAVGDIAYARLVVLDAYEVGTPVDLTWVLAFAVLAVATRIRLIDRPRVTEHLASPIPVLAVVGFVGIGTLGAAALSRDRGVLFAGTVASGLLIVVRQTILLSERRQLARTLAANIDKLQEADRAKDDFIAAISHDLRSPITAIRGFAEQLVRPQILDRPDTVREAASTIVRNSERLRRMVEDLLTAGQFASGGGPNLQVGRVDLLEVARRTVTDLGADVSLDGTPVQVIADAGRIEQILGNLIGNALTHAPGARITVRVAREDDRAELTVSDDGPGIGADRLEHVWDRFVTFRPDRASAGLGLYIVRMLARAMHGEAAVHSEPGRGTTFTVTFPAATEKLPQPAARQTTAH